MSTFTLDTATSRATPSPVPGKRITVPAIRQRKVGGTTADPIVMLTAYTMRMAQLLDPHCDVLLVGDSLAQIIYGLPSTVPVTLEMMCNHGAAVVRGSWHSMVAVDMPFGSYEASPEQAFTSAARIMKESGCAAVKLEGGEAIAPTIDFLSKRGIPVIGHVGLTPQAVNQLGGYGARGRSDAEAARILADTRAVADAGASKPSPTSSPPPSPSPPSASAPRRLATGKSSSPKTCSASSNAPPGSSNATTIWRGGLPMRCRAMRAK
jgi:3-methyl-2-oxobutanoate hydroxymethyltransferase